jgi:asparagine synthase (glutamine-hydrolysing)
MCGIAGIAQTEPIGGDRAVIDRILASQTARGPDHTGEEDWELGAMRLRLGHNRLKIIDLSDASNQPMWDRSRTCCIVYNGEVYNYLELRRELQSDGVEFATAGDAEVILESFKRWGDGAFERFNGMFAFALYEARANALWLVRDRFGVKPLYYWCDGARLAFASTTRAIAETFGLNPNLDYLRRGVERGIFEDRGDESPYEGLVSLPGGHLLRVDQDDEGRLRLDGRRWYDLEGRVVRLRSEIEGADERELVDRVRGDLEQAIDLRMRSDVPVGLSLSGGLDSSAIAALVADRHGPITGVSFGHPGDRSTEAPLVDRLARKIGMRVHYVSPTPAQIEEALDATIADQDAPFASASVIAQHLVFRMARQEGLTVMLGGQGGDEAFMGYRKYFLFRFVHLRRREGMLAAIAFLADSLPMALAEVRSIGTYWQHRDRYRKSGKSGSVVRFPGAAVPATLGLSSDDVAHRQMEDVLRYSLPTLLRYEDRNSMGSSVESRLPFLDYRLMELGLALPDELKLRRGFGKWALREAVASLVPDEIRLARYKRGFDVSLDRWLAHGFGGAIRRRLHERAQRVAAFLSHDLLIDEAFSDFALIHRRSAFVEAISLIWLGDRLR